MSLKNFTWAHNRNWDHHWQEFIGDKSTHPQFAGTTRAEILASAKGMLGELDQRLEDQNGKFQKAVTAVAELDKAIAVAQAEVIETRRQIAMVDQKILAAARK